MKERGFSLVELLVLVVVAGIVAAVALPALVRSRIAANEAETVGDIRTVISGSAAYASANAGLHESQLTCLNTPYICIPNYPITGPTFLDSELASLLPRSGYFRTLSPGPPPTFVPASASSSSVVGYAYLATPLNQGQTGVRGFAADASGKICWTPDGTPVLERAPGELDPDCRILD